jgi:hypothetical protein
MPRKFSWRTGLIGLMALGSLAGSQVDVTTAQSGGAVLSFVTSDTLPLPAGQVQGMTWIALDTVVVLTEIPDSLSSTGQRRVVLSFLDRRGLIFRQEDFTRTLDRGLTYDGEFLWSCGDDQQGGSQLFKIEPETCLVKEAYPTPGHHPCGVSWDGQYVWLVDRDSGRLDRFDPEQESVTRSVVTPGFSPFGLAHDGRYSWVSDSGTGRLYRLRGARRQWDGTVAAEFFAWRQTDVVLGFDGFRIWYAPVDSSYALRIQFR